MSSVPAPVTPEIATARGYIEAARAASTRRAYEDDWRRFDGWCRARGDEPLPAPPALVAVYLSGLAADGKTPPTIARAIAAIAHQHGRAGLVAPHRVEGGRVIADVLAGIRRSREAPVARKAAADADTVFRLLLAVEGEDLAALRDRAIVAFGMATALRRSELVALDVEDLEWDERGVRVRVRRSKTDQEGEGQVIAVPEGRRLRPVGHLKAWLDAAGITTGPLFRPLWKGGKRLREGEGRLSDRMVARIVQDRAAAAGLDPAQFVGHSLRAGFITSAARAGATEFKIREVSRHKSIQVLSGYVRDARLFEGHAGEGFL